MIDWYDLFANALWIVGLAGLLALVSWNVYAASLSGRNLRAQWQRPTSTIAFSLAMMLVAVGLAFQSNTPPWLLLLWLFFAGAFPLSAWLANRQRIRRPMNMKAWLRTQLTGTCAAAIGLIALGVLMGAMYAVTIRPWMQPDEPRHYEVVMHNARLGRPGAGYGDVNLAWERELIVDMEAQSFWWYGYSVIGWDPNNLPASFEEIWEPRYSRAFFQLPLYYDLAGLLLHTWGDTLTLSESVIALRFFGLVWLALSLGGIYAIGRELFPQRPEIALAALAFAALWPSHLAANAAVNNDPMAEALVVWTTLFALRVLRRGPSLKTLTWFFLMLILTLYTKRTGFSVLVLLLALPFWGVLQMQQSHTRRARTLGLTMLVGGVLAIPILLYVVQATGRYWLPTQLLENFSMAKIWALVSAAPLEKFLLSLYRTFWGWFGWLRVPLPDLLYGIGALITTALLGLLVVGYASIFDSRLARWQRAGLLLLFLMLGMQFGLTLGKDIVYGDWKGGSVPQMRYLYPVLPAMLLPTFLGWQRISSSRRWSWALPVIVLTLLAFNIYVLVCLLYPFFWL